MSQYCEEHDKIELVQGKCMACGDVEYKVSKEDHSFLMDFAQVALIICVMCILVIGGNLIHLWTQ